MLQWMIYVVIVTLVLTAAALSAERASRLPPARAPPPLPGRLEKP